MILRGCEIQLYIFDAYSLKDKRRVIKSLMERIRKRFNVSIAEIAEHELWNKTTIGFACVSNSNTQCEQVIETIINFIDYDERCEITKIERI
ncbi:DUF503 domain-containing protein [Vallitalea okinawensis]|uniref:DUF503 domain-containing protein n=1 Tax=Vallitalea okinawensis TaxID=2078660 RepID=UPI000CFA935E|nr:DUF503 domain-containing protein [Vallitalea okinawensis]